MDPQTIACQGVNVSNLDFGGSSIDGAGDGIECIEPNDSTIDIAHWMATI